MPAAGGAELAAAPGFAAGGLGIALTEGALLLLVGRALAASVAAAGGGRGGVALTATPGSKPASLPLSLLIALTPGGQITTKRPSNNPTSAPSTRNRTSTTSISGRSSENRVKWP